ncbi:MAG: inositol monophosphatase [Chthoniobacterales bacterium]
MTLDQLRLLLCRLGDSIRDAIWECRTTDTREHCAVAHQSASDTIYAIDKISEKTILTWFEKNWPASEPVEVVMEGSEDCGPLTFPAAPVDATKWKCIIDPIDGTRGIMYDKRSAWALIALAPQQGADTRLSHITVAAMTELPTSKQWRADQISAVRGQGITAQSFHLLERRTQPLTLTATKATDFLHGFSSFCKFFPEGRVLTATIEEKLWDTLYGLGSAKSPRIFDDQYISTGGQFYELLCGHDRLIADVRPLVLKKCTLDDSLVCHPYDACCALLLEEAGVIYEAPFGGFPDAPLDTTSSVSWVAYGNKTLADKARPALQKILHEVLTCDS